jgi:hypothetical protein
VHATTLTLSFFPLRCGLTNFFDWVAPTAIFLISASQVAWHDRSATPHPALLGGGNEVVLMLSLKLGRVFHLFHSGEYFSSCMDLGSLGILWKKYSQNIKIRSTFLLLKYLEEFTVEVI